MEIWGSLHSLVQTGEIGLTLGVWCEWQDGLILQCLLFRSLYRSYPWQSGNAKYRFDLCNALFCLDMDNHLDMWPYNDIMTVIMIVWCFNFARHTGSLIGNVQTGWEEWTAMFSSFLIQVMAVARTSPWVIWWCLHRKPTIIIYFFLPCFLIQDSQILCENLGTIVIKIIVARIPQHLRSC